MSNRELSPEAEIDPAFERRVVRSLFPSRRWIPFAIAAALVIGFVAGALQSRLRPATESGREYLLLLHGGSPGHVEEYRQWARSHRVRGGEKLKDEVVVLGEGRQESTLGGFFRIAAPSREEAEAVARTCPHLKYGGWIELREVDRV